MSPYIVTTKRPEGHDVAKAVSCGGTGVLRVCECGMQSDMAENDGACPYAVSRRAVATVEEAATCVGNVVRKWRDDAATRETWNAAYAFLLAAENLPESGGTVGPLPDGTVIEVERVTNTALYEELNVRTRILMVCDEDTAEVVAAFNAKQAT